MPRAGRPILLTLNLVTLRARLPLDNDRPTLSAHQPLGALAVLPNELLCEILANYATLVKSHRDVLRVVVASSATSNTCRDLYAELENTKCRKCSANATHLYLITCHLVCRRCFGGHWQRDVPPQKGISRASRAKWHPVLGLLREFEEYVPLQEEHVLEHYEYMFEELKEAPYILSLPAW
ncbi:hypothetical protein B0T25DRAFT_569426 [Lasiosphaeria hispida]|uniref:F-box domain-containing protein n=1 Tax=Lasiosphaeria hispida TaxID=260671 RepID=A0AAJ0HDA7_9PEZI|nr:hypothetical protein B0T25DRAFT_569426 [Lasiosphaeria hispida]